MGLKLIFEGASHLTTKANSRFVSMCTNPTAAQAKLPGVERCTSVDSYTVGTTVIGHAGTDRQDQARGTGQLESWCKPSPPGGLPEGSHLRTSQPSATEEGPRGPKSILL